MHNVPLEFERLPVIAYNLPPTIRWQIHGSAEGTIQITLVSVERSCSAGAKLGTDIDVRLGVIPVPRLMPDPCLYVLQATNQTKADHILATSHSFYIAPPSHDSGSNIMASISSNNAGPEPSSACDRTFPGTIMEPQKPKSELGTIIGVMVAVAVPCLMLLAIILWKVSRPSRRSEEPHSGSDIDPIAHSAHVNPFCESQSPGPGQTLAHSTKIYPFCESQSPGPGQTLAHSTHINPFCESQSPGQSPAQKTLRSMTSWDQSISDSSGFSLNTPVTPISIRTPYPTPCQPASSLPPQPLQYIPSIYGEAQRNAGIISEQGRDLLPNTIPSERQRLTSCSGPPSLQEKGRSPPPQYSVDTCPQSS